MDLYHFEIGFPDTFKAPTHLVRLRWTKHADRARTNDRYGDIPRATFLDLSKCQVIEIGVEAGKVIKYVMRTRLDDERDLCIVLIPGKEWTIKTVWVNLKTDLHKTLDRSKYVNLQSAAR